MNWVCIEVKDKEGDYGMKVVTFNCQDCKGKLTMEIGDSPDHVYEVGRTYHLHPCEH